jgi:hypothetical protein
MFSLPKANPLYEKIPSDKVIIPDVLEKLGKGHFSGYLLHTARDFESCCIFAKGKLICAISTEGGGYKTGFEAINALFDKVLGSEGQINIYRMTADIAMCAHAQVLGTRLLNGEEVRKSDIKSLLTRMKNQNMNGVVRFFTDERSAMIFYKNGMPVGFYHDSIREVETSPDEARKIAALPGARVEASTTKPIEELMLYDLLQVTNLQKMWEAARSRRAAPGPKDSPSPAKAAAQNIAASVEQDNEKLAELVGDLQEVAMAYLSREGRFLIEKCIREAGGSSILRDVDRTEEMLRKIGDQARAIDSQARVGEMIDLMRSEIAGRLAV